MVHFLFSFLFPKYSITKSFIKVKFQIVNFLLHKIKTCVRVIRNFFIKWEVAEVFAIGRNGVEIAARIVYGIGKGSGLDEKIIHIPEDTANGDILKFYIGEDGIDFHFFISFSFLNIV